MKQKRKKCVCFCFKIHFVGGAHRVVNIERIESKRTIFFFFHFQYDWLFSLFISIFNLGSDALHFHWFVSFRCCRRLNANFTFHIYRLSCTRLAWLGLAYSTQRSAAQRSSRYDYTLYISYFIFIILLVLVLLINFMWTERFGQKTAASRSTLRWAIRCTQTVVLSQ